MAATLSLLGKEFVLEKDELELINKLHKKLGTEERILKELEELVRRVTRDGMWLQNNLSAGSKTMSGGTSYISYSAWYHFEADVRRIFGLAGELNSLEKSDLVREFVEIAKWAKKVSNEIAARLGYKFDLGQRRKFEPYAEMHAPA